MSPSPRDSNNTPVIFAPLGTPIVAARFTVHDNLKDALFELSWRAEEVATEHDKSNIANVVRDCVMDGGIRAFARKTFIDECPLNVKFAGEFRIDNVGPSREFPRLLLPEINNRYFYRPEKGRNLRIDAIG